MKAIDIIISGASGSPFLNKGGGEGIPKTTRAGVATAIFSWREIAGCFWATGLVFGGKSHDHRRF